MKMKSVMTGLGIGIAKALKAMENMFDDMQDMFK